MWGTVALWLEHRTLDRENPGSDTRMHCRPHTYVSLGSVTLFPGHLYSVVSLLSQFQRLHLGI